MEFIINSWYIILAFIAVLVVSAVVIYRYLGLPREEQLAKVREWLLWAVTGAEFQPTPPHRNWPVETPASL